MKYFSFIVVFLSLSFTNFKSYKKSDLLGKFNPKTHAAFSKVSSDYSDRNIYLRNEVISAFVKMAMAAEKDNIDLKILSGTRNFEKQKEIWERKWETLKGSKLEKLEVLLHYISMPGTSRHHWGTDFDLNALEPEYFESAEGAKIYDWLNTHAWKFGFFQPYTKLGENRTNGYKEEKWHWSYYPISNQLLQAYNNLITYEDLSGFSGAELSDSLDVIDRYVKSISIPRNLEYSQIRNRYLND